LDEQWLAQLSPLNELTSADRTCLADKAHVIHVSRGFTLDSSDEYRWLIYLQSGRLELITKDYSTFKISANNDRSKQPVFSEKDHKIRAVAEEPSTIVRFDRQYFNTLFNQALLTAEQVETFEVTEAEGDLFASILHAYNLGKLELPSIPEIALKVKEAISDPDVTAESLSRILEADPAIVARLMQVANSPINRGVNPLESISAAIIRLGFTTTRDLVLCLSIKELFTATSPLLNKRMQSLYDHSTEVAAIAYTLANKATHLEADNLLLAGLLHDIGVIPILVYIDQSDIAVDSMDQVEEIISDLRIAVGSMVVNNWLLSPDLVSVVENAENWGRDVAGEADMCDVILAAQIYYRLLHHQLEDIPTPGQVPAFHKLFPEHQNPQLINEILAEAEAEVEEVKRLLRM